MLTDGITLIGDSQIENLTIQSGASLPLTATKGELFFLDGTGLHVHDGTNWVSVEGGGATASGANGYVQFANAGDLSSSSNLTFNVGTGALSASAFIGNGTSITGLSATNLGFGTVPTARLGSGTASTTTYLRGDSTWAELTVGNGNITLSTPVNATSGTTIDFTGIPSWAKKITVMYTDLSTSGASLVAIRVGTSSGFLTAGYKGSYFVTGGSAGSIGSNFVVTANTNANDIRHGDAQLTLQGNNKWTYRSLGAISNAANVSTCAGSVALADTLTQIRVMTANGTDTFDGGVLNILIEG